MKKLIATFALCLFAAGASRGQNYSDMLYRDWAGLRAFAQVNRNLTVEPEVVFMGNSITEGWFNYHPDFFKKNNFACRGIGGQTSSEMLVRFRQDVIELHPRVVAILAGTNDIAMNNGYIALENTFQNIVSMCELAKFNGIKVLLCSVTPAAYFNWRPQVEPAKIIPKLNKMLREYAEATEGVEWVDYFTPMVGEDKAMRAEYSPEGSHPNGEGYKVMERIVVPAINKIQGTNKKYFIYE
ncbi:GDSL-type esterase/lipase family protein [Alistipes dispar]|uniref:GDSL-type esterase/lipase family protein n=1 Tax=Alistipes dispar TaxID=2585119 RepID=UPI001F90F8C4|nr:GDSL-type esterase/lipase family protein [Alistipes dispar]HJC19083.1 acylhydrolase [Candidatus Alistipes stercoripullorum]